MPPQCIEDEEYTCVDDFMAIIDIVSIPSFGYIDNRRRE